jgi:hypothetical protein
MDPEQLVVDQALHQVEHAPAGEEQAEMRAPRGCELAALPGSYQEDRRREHEKPCGQVEEPVDERVRLQPGHGVHRLAAVIASEHVVPLQDLVKHDPVDEPAEAQAQDK